MAEPWEISWGNLHVIPTTVLVLSIMLLGLMTFSLVIIIFQLVILMNSPIIAKEESEKPG